MRQPDNAPVAGFELLRPLDGGKGRVWLARETALGRDVALKFQAEAGDGAAARDALLAEADILARCDHPSIVPFYRAVPGEPPARAFYAMKAIPASLRERIGGGKRLPEASVRRLGREIAEALARLHGFSPPVAHRAVTPENILIDIDGRAVLAGFGRARPVAGGGLEEAEDVHALGAVLFEAFVGRPSEESSTAGSLGAEEIRRLPRRWRRLLGRMLDPDPAARPTAAAVAAQLAPPPRGRRRRMLALAAAFVAASSFLLFCLRPAERAEEIVEEALYPLYATNTLLRPRLPAITRDALGKIPRHWQKLANDSSVPHAGEFQSRVLAMNFRETSSPHRSLWQGAQRTVRLPGGVLLEMSGVPRGAFRRGYFLPEGAEGNSECDISPETVMVTRAFWMARTELTRAQYAAVTRFAPAVVGHPARRLRSGEGRNGRPLEIEGGDLPVGEDLDFADVQRFIDQLNALCGLEGDRRFRLPTEAEWELACRAFVAKPFEGEGNPGDAAWTGENSGGAPHPVAQKAMNPLGLFDLHGNLAEWCADAYGPYGDWPPFDPCVAPSSNDAPRVVRGGSFHDASSACDSNARAPALPTDKGYAIRLVAWP